MDPADRPPDQPPVDPRVPLTPRGDLGKLPSSLSGRTHGDLVMAVALVGVCCGAPLIPVLSAALGIVLFLGLRAPRGCP